MKKTILSGLVGAGLLLAGCGDSSYNCQSEEMFLNAMAIRDGYGADNPNFIKYTELVNQYIKDIKIDLIAMNDKEKASVCEATYYFKNLTKDDFYKLYSLPPLSKKDADNILTAMSLSGITLNNIHKVKMNIKYGARDNGRGDTYIEVEQ